MIHIVHKNDSDNFPELFRSMYEHRAAQFRDRLNWEVNVDADGKETDEYDSINPLYVILTDEQGTHCASMRFLPTTGDTMINDHFTELTGGVVIKSPYIWECTRFCLAPNADRRASRKVLLATMELGLRLKVEFFVGVFSKQMLRVYQRIGWSPVVVGQGEVGGDEVCSGLWPVSQEVRLSFLARCHEDDSDTLSYGDDCWSIGSDKQAA